MHNFYPIYAGIIQILTFDDSRVLISVVSDEQLSSTREDLLGYPVHSHSELTLLNKVAVGQDAIQRPTGLVSESILINGVSNRSIWLIAYRSLRFIKRLMMIFLPPLGPGLCTPFRNRRCSLHSADFMQFG